MPRLCIQVRLGCIQVRLGELTTHRSLYSLPTTTSFCGKRSELCLSVRSVRLKRNNLTPQSWEIPPATATAIATFLLVPPYHHRRPQLIGTRVLECWVDELPVVVVVVVMVAVEERRIQNQDNQNVVHSVLPCGPSRLSNENDGEKPPRLQPPHRNVPCCYPPPTAAPKRPAS